MKKFEVSNTTFKKLAWPRDDFSRDKKLVLWDWFCCVTQLLLCGGLFASAIIAIVLVNRNHNHTTNNSSIHLLTCTCDETCQTNPVQINDSSLAPALGPCDVVSLGSVSSKIRFRFFRFS